MLKRRLVFFGLAALALFMLLYSGDGIYLWVLVLQGLVLAAGAVNVGLTFACMTVVQDVTPGSPEQGGHALLHIEVHNAFALPFCHLVLRCGTVRSALDREPREFFASVPPYSCEKADVEIFCPHCGEYDIGVLEARGTDLFGLVTWRMPARRLHICGRRKMTVLPRVGETLAWSASGTSVAGAAVLRTVTGRSGGGAGSGSTWLLPRRRGSFAAQTGVTQRVQLTILMDFTRVPQRSDGFVLRDMMTGAAAAIAQRRCASGGSVRVIAFGRERYECEALSRDEFETMRETLARVQFGGGTDFAAAFGLESAMGSEFVVVCSELTEELCSNVLGLENTKVSVVICLEDGEYTPDLVRELGDFRMGGVSAVSILPGDDLLAGLEGVL